MCARGILNTATSSTGGPSEPLEGPRRASGVSASASVVVSSAWAMGHSFLLILSILGPSYYGSALTPRRERWPRSSVPQRACLALFFGNRIVASPMPRTLRRSVHRPHPVVREGAATSRPLLPPREASSMACFGS